MKNMSITKKCTGCYQSFPLNEIELGIDESTKEYLCIHCNHSRYADVDDTHTHTKKTTKCDFCNPLVDIL